MKVILYMATTINGLIARKDYSTPWSDAEFVSYYQKVREVGNVIVGNKTYPQFRESDFDAMGHSLMVVLTRSNQISSKQNVIFVHSASEALEVVKSKGFETALVTGGGETNTTFLDAGLINEIYLDIEPQLFGQGVPLFSPTTIESQLELVDTKNISPQTIQLHYKVIK